jgi:hypothetical protein
VDLGLEVGGRDDVPTPLSEIGPQSIDTLDFCIGQPFECGEPGRRRDGVGVEGPGVLHLPDGGIELSHELFTTAEGTDGKTTADELAVSDEIWIDSPVFVGTPVIDAERDDLVEYERDVVLRCDAVYGLHEAV